MRAWLEGAWDRQVGLDEYLPGTPHTGRSLLDAFPYHIWGRSSMPGKDDAAATGTAEERKFREQDAIRRRQFPSCFEEACAYGNVQAAILMWSQGTVDIPTRRAVYEGNNASALMWASFKGHLPVVRFLVDHGAPLDATNSLGHTALQWSITAGHTDVARYLLDHGADPSQRDRQGFDAAFAAVQNDRLALLLMLTEDAAREGHLLPTSDHGTVFYQPTPEQRTQAATVINPRTRKPYYLLDPAMRDVEGHTLMHWAAYRNSPATCQYLIDHWGYEVDARDKHGRTPLVWAAREGFAEVLELLLSRGADRNAADSDSWTALQYARTRNHPEAVYVLSSYPVALASSADGIPSDSARAALLSSSSGNSNGHNTSTTSGGTSNGARYVCVRDRRAYGTVQMIRTHTIFAVMAVSGPLYLALTYVLMNLLPPMVSYFPFGIYFFKNVAWTSLTPPPTQSSRAGPPPSITKVMGIAANIADSVRGTWLFRVRDPANLCIWIAFLLVQVAAWNALGLPQLFASNDKAAHGGGQSGGAADMWPTWAPATAYPSAAAAAASASRLHPPLFVHYVGLSFFRFFTLQSNPLNSVGGYAAYEAPPNGMSLSARATMYAAAEAYVAQSQSLVRWVLMLLLVGTIVCAVLCKLCAARSMLRSSEEGTLRTSPLWRIVAARQYRWLHPRFFFQERHVQLPLRAFYCHERDVIVRGYDGYSNLLDSPIGHSNHLFFVLMLTFFTLFELFVMLWGLQHMQTLLQCPVRVPWYHDAFFAFQPTDAMAAALQARAGRPVGGAAAGAVGVGAANTTAPLESDAVGALSSAVISFAAPVISFAWLNTGMDVLLHGLPCRQYARLDTMTRDYLNAVAAASVDGAAPSTLANAIRRFFFLIQYYVWPTKASALGIWVLHYSLLCLIAMGTVAVRQWIGVWYGATRMELANPLAQGSDGDLVSIFPKDLQKAQRVAPIDAEDERYYAAVCPSKARAVHQLPEQGGRCIYADGSGPVNILAFLLGRWGRRWSGAMTVSAHNTPVKTPMLM